MRSAVYLCGIICIISIISILPGFNGDLPGTFEVQGIPDDGTLINPLNATVILQNGTTDDLIVNWYLDGEMIGEGAHIQRYIYPGIHNLTVTLKDGDENILSRSFILDPVPPPGWGEEPDNDRNRLIFWLIFGSGGLIFAGVAAWVWMKKDEGSEQDERK